MTSFVARCQVAAPREALCAWHARPGAFERLTPPGDRVRLVEDSGGITDGARKVLAIGPLGVRWVAVHDRHVAGRRFRDVQRTGPFRRWEHTHAFLDDPDGPGSILEDSLEYELPLGRLGEIAAGWAIRRKLAALFAHRHRVTRHDVQLFAREPALAVPVAIVGGSSGAGLLRAFLGAGGWTQAPGAGEAFEVRCGAVHPRNGPPIAPFADESDASLAEVHRALRRHLGADRYPAR